MADDVFMVDAYGEFSPSQVNIYWRDEPRRPHAELDALVARTWSDYKAQCDRNGVMLFNGYLARYLNHQVQQGELIIDAGPTDFANFIGTNYLNYHRVDEFGWHLFGNPLGISATLITSDGWLILGRRNQRVACHAGYVHTIGGGLELNEMNDNGKFDPFASLQRELNEELGIKQEDIKEIVCLGLIRDRQILQPEIIFDAHLNLSRDDLGGRINIEDPDEEHDAMVECRDDPKAIVPFIRTTRMMAPIAVGAICLHGQRCFGHQWYAHALNEINTSC